MTNIHYSFTLCLTSVTLFLLVFTSCENFNEKNHSILKENQSITASHEPSDSEKAPAEPSASLRDSIVNFGLELLGTPYKTASCSRDGFDCSGFVFYTFKNFGINVPRNSSAYEGFGEEVPIEKVKKGDVLLFLSPTRNVIGHVGIVSKAEGKESEFIHATSGKAMSVVISSLTQEGYKKRFVKAVNVLQ